MKQREHQRDDRRADACEARHDDRNNRHQAHRHDKGAAIKRL